MGPEINLSLLLGNPGKGDAIHENEAKEKPVGVEDGQSCPGCMGVRCPCITRCAGH